MVFNELEQLWFGEDSTSLARETAAAQRASATLSAVGPRPFTPIAQRLLRAVRNPFYETADIVRLIELDPALAARVLRIVNSAAYALAVRVASLPHAVTLLGANAIADLALAASLLDMFDDCDGATARVREHSTLVASLARYIAMYCGLPTDAVYTCGLLHDVGRLLLLQSVAGEGHRCHDATSQGDVAALDERALYGFDHATLGGCSLRDWGVPEPIPTVVSLHHRPAYAFSQPALIARLVSLVRFADRLSYALAVQDAADSTQIDQLGSDECACYLGLDSAHLLTVWDDLQLIAMDAERRLAPPFKMRVRRALPPRQQPPVFTSCVVCGEQTEGGTCVRCDSALCNDHLPSDDRRCPHCETEYQQARSIRSTQNRQVWQVWGAALGGVGLLATLANAVPLLGVVAVMGCLGTLPLLVAPLALGLRARRGRQQFLREFEERPLAEQLASDHENHEPILASSEAADFPEQQPSPPREPESRSIPPEVDQRRRGGEGGTETPEQRPTAADCPPAPPRPRRETRPLAVVAGEQATSGDSRRRRSPRLTCDAPVEFQGEQSGGSGMLRDIGAAGVRIRTEDPPSVGADLLLEFCLPGNDSPIRTMGRVVWCSEKAQDAEGSADFGVSANDDSLERGYSAVLASALARYGSCN
jgi:HD-like signal output (HDOD) protein/Tfp pilus assembly protein PilZ